MKKYYLEIPESEKPAKDDMLTYGRPSVSAWIAAAAVAFAFFLLGGFIKTYHQLQTLREESRQEIRELRESVRRLQVGEGRQTARARQLRYLPQPLPPAERDSMPREGGRPPMIRADAIVAPSSPLSDMARAPTPGWASLDDQDDIDRWRVSVVGRRKPEESRQLAYPNGDACQVVSVLTARKRLMIEGGRDMGLSEGMRLELCRDGRWIGDLRVKDVYETLASCEVLLSTAPPEPGDSVRTVQQ